MSSQLPERRLGRDFQTLVPLRDGKAIRVRAIRPDDKQRLIGHFSRLSERSVYQRFFGVKSCLTPDDLVHFTELDFVDAVGLVATLGEGEDERIVGVGRYFVDPAGDNAPRRAEVAFAVEDAQQGRGIATRLLQQLLPFARQGGIVALEGDVLADNIHMLHVFSRMGFQTVDQRHGVVRMRLAIEARSERRSA
jgi:GNAT superfamily N-acetyltransferase